MLTLSLFLPPNPTRKISGSAGFPLYDGWFDVSLLQSTIVIASNYRLGVLGFLAGDALRSESPDGSVGTYGTQDQTAALEFIRDTAAAFGGDASRVTIFGQSAGAASVAAHMVSPPSKGLFHRAIIESGAFSTWTAQPYNISKTRLAQFAANTGCAGAGAALLACLRALNASQVLQGDRGLTSAFLEWSPTIDGVVVPDDPRVLLAQGQAVDIPVIMGFNADEGSMFVRAPKDLNASAYVGAIGAILGAQQAAAVAAAYPCADYKADLGQSDCWWALAAVERDAMFTCPVTSSAAELVAQPGRANAQNTFTYNYRAVLAVVDIVDLFKPYRCFHGSELVSVFYLWPALIGFGEENMAEWFTRAWGSFAATGAFYLGGGSRGAPHPTLHTATQARPRGTDTRATRGTHAHTRAPRPRRQPQLRWRAGSVGALWRPQQHAGGGHWRWGRQAQQHAQHLCRGLRLLARAPRGRGSDLGVREASAGYRGASGNATGQGLATHLPPIFHWPKVLRHSGSRTSAASSSVSSRSQSVTQPSKCCRH